MNDSKLNVVLYRVGDQRPVTISHDKCLIRTVHDNQQIDCCAIYNGPNGTALRTYSNNVLVNGESTAVRWLSAGDQIQLPCSAKIEVRQATLLRPIFSDRKRTVSEIDQQLAAIGGLSKEAPAVSNTEPTETFHSPFSKDLSEVDATIAESTVGKPARAAEAKITEEVPLETSANPAVSKQASAGIAIDDLESIFARVGVTNVGSIAHPGASAADKGKTVEQPPGIHDQQVSQADETPSAKQVTQLDDVAKIRKELEALLAGSPSPEAVPSTEPAATEVSNVSASAPPAAAMPELPKVAIPTTPASLSKVNPPAVTQATVPTLADPAPVVPAEAVPTPAVPTPAVPTPAVPVSAVPTLAAKEPAIVEEPAASDPLAELPDDLRNQLNDLVSSLENEVPDAPAAEPVASVVPEQVTPTAVVPETVEALPEPVQTVAETIVPSETADSHLGQQPSVLQSAPVETAPVRDPSISTMFEDAMRAIQGDTEQAAEPAVGVASPDEVPTVSEATVPEPTPLVPQPAAKPQSVADVLGAMGMAVPGASEMDTPTSPNPTPETSPTPTTTRTPAPEPVAEQTESIAQNVPGTPVFANIQNASETAPPPASSAGENAEDDIQAYMNRLLNRTTTDSDSNSPTAVPAATPTAVEKKEPQQVLSAEEFVPSHKATRPENYDTLREIANTSSRTAVQQSSRRAQMNSILFKIFCFLAVLLGSGVALWLGKTLIAGLLVFVAIGSAFAFLKANNGLPELPPREQSDAP